MLSNDGTDIQSTASHQRGNFAVLVGEAFAGRSGPATIMASLNFALMYVNTPRCSGLALSMPGSIARNLRICVIFEFFIEFHT